MVFDPGHSTAKTQPRAYTIRQFVESYRISRAKIYRLIDSGDLRAVKVGSRTLITTESAEAWFTSLPSVGAAQ